MKDPSRTSHLQQTGPHNFHECGQQKEVAILKHQVTIFPGKKKTTKKNKRSIPGPTGLNKYVLYL